jgi:hypothetical protein
MELNLVLSVRIFDYFHEGIHKNKQTNKSREVIGKFDFETRLATF